VESINQFSIRRLGCRYSKIMFRVSSGTPVSFTPFGVNLFVWNEEKCLAWKKNKTFFWGHFQCQNAKIKVHPWLKSALLSYVDCPQFYPISDCPKLSPSHLYLGRRWGTTFSHKNFKLGKFSIIYMSIIFVMGQSKWFIAPKRRKCFRGIQCNQ
jgi:hypothetical protein